MGRPSPEFQVNQCTSRIPRGSNSDVCYIQQSNSGSVYLLSFTSVKLEDQNYSVFTSLPMMKIVFLFVAVLFQETSANFLCFCNFLHPYGSYLYECPSRSSQLIGIIYPPENTDHYVDLSSPHCVAAFNAQAPQGWVAIYYNSNNVNKVYIYMAENMDD